MNNYLRLLQEAAKLDSLFKDRGQGIIVVCEPVLDSATVWIGILTDRGEPTHEQKIQPLESNSGDWYMVDCHLQCFDEMMGQLADQLKHYPKMSK